MSYKIPDEPDIPNIENKIPPGEDFYNYINNNWQMKTKIPSYMSSYGVSEEIEDIVNKELLHILYDSQKHALSNKAPTKNVYLLGTLTESIENNNVQDINVKFVKETVSSFKCIRDQADIASTMGDFIRHRIPTLINMYVGPIEHESKNVKLILSPNTKLGLPDFTYYSPSYGKKTVISAYNKLLQELGAAFEITGLEEIFGIERIIASAILAGDIDDEEIITNGAELKDKYKNIPWDILLFTTVSWAQIDKHTIVIKNKHFFKELNKWFISFPLQTWKLLFSSQLILHVLPLLPAPFDDMEFELYGKLLRGQDKKIPKNILILHLAKQWLSNSLGNVFVHKYVSKELKEKASKIASEIKKSAMEVAGSTPWLEPKTQKVARAKVKSIHLGVAYPSNIHNDKKIILNPEKLIYNIFNLGMSDFNEEIKKIDTILDPSEWDDDVFAVNAYYYNEGNRLILPSGILRWPFFHEGASDGWNYGGLGATIGHEISHAFDNDGKDFDEHGNRNVWWSRAEQMRYHKKTKTLIDLYNKTKYFGQHLNGVLTLSENIADLGGVQIALNALKNALKNKNASEQETHNQICDFFHSFAVSWRTKEKKEKAEQSLFMDVHAPPPARVNNIVRQFDDWYTCFNVKPGDKLYTAPDERIRIF
jgi:putative endopeptidase